MTPDLVESAQNQLARRCGVMRSLIDEHGDCTIVQRRKPLFHSLVSSVISQQLSVKAAASIEGRLREEVNAGRHFKPGDFKRVDAPRLRRCGLSGAKTKSILEIGRQSLEGELPLRKLHYLDDLALRERLVELPGIGPWTVDMVMMFSLNRPDILPLGDLALRRAIAQAYDLGDAEDLQALKHATEHLRPWRTVASWYLWCLVD